MKKQNNKTGFTIVEVSLVLAIMGMMFAGLAAGVSGAVSRQRFFEAAQDYDQFLQNLYSTVTSVQSDGNGQSNTAIYGKVITFNEQPGKVYVYDLFGDILSGDKFTGLNPIESLTVANARILVDFDDNGNAYVPHQQAYSPTWNVTLQTTEIDTPFTGTLLIIRTPLTGIIHTYYSSETLEMQEYLNDAETDNDFTIDLITQTFDTETLNFCLYSSDRPYLRRRNLRLHADGHNSSAVDLINLDSEDNQC